MYMSDFTTLTATCTIFGAREFMSQMENIRYYHKIISYNSFYNFWSIKLIKKCHTKNCKKLNVSNTSVALYMIGHI